MKTHRFNRLPARGAALLVVTFLLLFLMALVVLYMNRSLLFEQKSSASLERSTRAFELAEAGLEWGLANLNNPLRLDSSCTPLTDPKVAGTDFRTRYINPAEQPTRFAIPPSSRASCTVNSVANTLSCSCPAPGTAPVLGSADAGRFTVQFNQLAADPLAVELVARGCTSADPQCGDVSGAADATAVSRLAVKLVSTFGRAPPATMAAGGFIEVGGNLTVVNTDHASNGVTINSGSTVTAGSGTTVVTLPGTPTAMSILDNDPTLSALSSLDADGDRFFQSFFSKDMETFRNQTLTKVILATDCGSAIECGELVASYIDQGYQQFWLYPDVTFTSSRLPETGTLGTESRPVFIATAGSLELKAAITAYGMFYAASRDATQTWDYTGSGTATVFGAFVTRGNFNKGSGSLNLIYNPRLFGLGGGRPVGTLVRVPGSWRDF